MILLGNDKWHNYGISWYIIYEPENNLRIYENYKRNPVDGLGILRGNLLIF